MSKKLKSLCALICTAVLMLTMCVSAAGVFLEGANIRSLSHESFDSVPIYLNGKYMCEAVKTGNTSYVSINEFCEKMLNRSCSMRWDSGEVTLSIVSGNVFLLLDLSRYVLLVNDRCLYLQGGVYNIDGEVYVPVRPLAMAFAASLSWRSDEENCGIYLSRRSGDMIISGNDFYNADDLYWLSRVIYAESGNQPLAGMIGVGNVVLNRVRDHSGSFPDSVYGVIFQPGQFSVVDNGTIYSQPPEHCILAAKLCLEGFSTVGDSLFFLNPSISSSLWFDNHRVFRLSIGEHYFYA